MGTVREIRANARGVTLGVARDAFLATLDHPETRATRRGYGSALEALAAALGPDTDLASLTPAALSAAFRACWASSAPSTWNTRRASIGALLAWCQGQDWIPDAKALMAGIESRRLAPDRTRALSRAEVESLLTDSRHSLRDRTLWRMLYETAARSAEILRLNAEDLDLPNKRARVRRKGGAQDVIVWQSGTAILLSRLLKGRSGPVFATDRKARVPLPPADLDEHGHARLSYRQAEDLFKAAAVVTLGREATLHQLRHSALTHDAERGTNTAMLMARSGHQSVRTLAKYARVSPEALQRHQEANDPARRR